MSCALSNAHAIHKVLRGCCTNDGNVCCESRSAYYATKYCECNDTAGNNQSIPYSDDLCALLAMGFTGQSLTSAGYYTYLDSDAFDYSVFNCGALTIYVTPTAGGTGILTGTVFNGDITVTNTTIPVIGQGDLYNVYVGEDSSNVCGTVRIV